MPGGNNVSPGNQFNSLNIIKCVHSGKYYTYIRGQQGVIRAADIVLVCTITWIYSNKFYPGIENEKKNRKILLHNEHFKPTKKQTNNNKSSAKIYSFKTLSIF